MSSLDIDVNDSRPPPLLITVIVADWARRLGMSKTN